MALVPILYLLAGEGSTRPGFELATGASATNAPPQPGWLTPDRIVTETPSSEPLSTTPTTTTTAAATTAATTAAGATSGATPALSGERGAPAAGGGAEPSEEEAAPAPGRVAEPAPAPGATPAPTPATASTPATADTTTTTTTTPQVRLTGPLAPTSKPAGRKERGQATWFNAPDGSCAHRTAPIGTVITVTRVWNGATTTCVVDQWGPEAAHRVIDLSMDTFEKLAPPEVGVIDVVIEW